MIIKIRFFTVLRELTNKKEETLNFKNRTVTVSDIIKSLSEKYGKAFDDYVFDSKTQQLKGFLQFLINGTSAATLEGLKSTLQDGDVLAILPPVGGG